MATPKKKPVKKNDLKRKTQINKVTAREARDIITAVGTAIRAELGYGGGYKKSFETSSMARANLKKQIKEVKTSAKTGKPGTASKVYHSKASGGSDFIIPNVKGQYARKYREPFRKTNIKGK
jgi:hypothetical protein